MARAFFRPLIASVFSFSTFLNAFPNSNSESSCPYLDIQKDNRYNAAVGFGSSLSLRHSLGNVNGIVIDYKIVKADIKSIFKQSQDWWPADDGNYAPFFIRQAWHCAGSYRVSDGNGGCDGGRQRFEPELSWDDNINLDKAKKLLWPIKQKYGNALSWGDLIILAGTTAIESMNGPSLGFCGGRLDDQDGTDSLLLGPDHIQEINQPCAVNGQCKPPFGTTTIGLIYVNPEGPMGVPDPVQSALEIRDTFNRMDFDDWETVALIGGGHTFGKTHGACPAGPGASPKEDPLNPWPYPGPCGEGIYTSGFEGPWVSSPTHWSGEYFYNLLNLNWTKSLSPAGKTQWAAQDRTDIMMMTSDVALISDPIYLNIVKAYSANATLFANAFKQAWYKVVTGDMGPATRCVGDLVPPPQPFQNPLPPPPSAMPDWSQVRLLILQALRSSNSILPPDSNSYYGALFVSLAYNCFSTFRSSDWRGGCNGARIRFSPEKDWPVNVDVENILQILEKIKTQFGDELTWADLITFAGVIALEDANSVPSISIPFCPGRSDSLDGLGSRHLTPSVNYTATAKDIKARAKLMGLTNREFIVLQARLRSPLQMGRLGFESQSYTSNIDVLSNEYFRTLVNNEWKQITVQPSGFIQYQSISNSSLYMTPFDLSIRSDPALLAIAQDYASNNTLFIQDFVRSWNLLANADRFLNGSNPCYELKNQYLYRLINSDTDKSTFNYVTLLELQASVNKNGNNSSSSIPLMVVIGVSLMILMGFVLAIILSRSVRNDKVMKNEADIYQPLASQN